MMKSSVLAIVLTLVLIISGCTEIPIENGGSSMDESSVADSSSATGEEDGSSAPQQSTSSEQEESNATPPSSSEQSGDDPSQSTEDSSVGTEDSKVIKFLACPDNIIHPSVYYHALQTAAKNKGVDPDYSDLQSAEYDFTPIYENIAAMVKAADISYINVETLIGGNQNPISGYPMFNSPETAGQTLVDMGFDIFNLAHNHMLDSGNDKYLINCDRFFNERGGVTLGYYENKDDLNNIVIYQQDGVKIAFLAYTYSTNGISLSSSASTYIPYINSQLMKDQMALARERADLIFVSMHWGDEDSYTPNYAQRSAAQTLVDEGADVIIGMHPHVIQESKWVTRADGSRCFLTYSLGNLVSGMYGGKNTLGSLLSLDIISNPGEKPYVDNVQVIPTVCHYEKETSVNYQMDTGFRQFKIYLLEDYTEELAAAHGCHKNKGKINAFDNLLDGNFSVASLYTKVYEIIPKEFLPESYQ